MHALKGTFCKHYQTDEQDAMTDEIPSEPPAQSPQIDECGTCLVCSQLGDRPRASQTLGTDAKSVDS